MGNFIFVVVIVLIELDVCLSVQATGSARHGVRLD